MATEDHCGYQHLGVWEKERSKRDSEKCHVDRDCVLDVVTFETQVALIRPFQILVSNESSPSRMLACYFLITSHYRIQCLKYELEISQV